MKQLYFNIITLCILLCATQGATVLAKNITLSPRHDITLTSSQDALRISGTFTITNLGDDTAYQVSPAFWFGTRSSSSAWSGEKQQLPPGDHATWQIHLELSTKDAWCIAYGCTALTGAHPLYFLLQYHDANGHLFSAPHVGTLLYGTATNAAQSALSIKTECSPVRGQASCTTQLTKSTPAIKDIRVVFFTTEDLEFVEPASDLSHGISSSNKKIDILLRNKRALTGNNYPLFAIASTTTTFGERVVFISSTNLAIKECLIIAPWVLFLLGGVVSAVLTVRAMLMMKQNATSKSS